MVMRPPHRGSAGSPVAVATATAIVRNAAEQILTMKVLVIEDEPRTAGYTRQGLSESGFVVDIAVDGLDGLHYATTGHYDAIILDVRLPQCDGWSILRELRAQDPATPVLMLTGCGTVEDRVKGLELGADDYLVKPFAFTELLARLHALLRRGQQPQVAKLQVADLEIDVLRQKVQRDGQRIDLAPKEFCLLCLLARRCGQILTRTLIAEQVWDMNFQSDTNVVDVAVRRLRSKVDEPFPKKLVHSVRGRGYVLEER